MPPLSRACSRLRDKAYVCLKLSRAFQTGWMMWNWMVGALAAGAAIVLYDGSPFSPTATVLWDVIDEAG